MSLFTQLLNAREDEKMRYRLWKLEFFPLGSVSPSRKAIRLSYVTFGACNLSVRQASSFSQPIHTPLLSSSSMHYLKQIDDIVDL